jgi:GNAT superfamily N-acetyltransferase
MSTLLENFRGAGTYIDKRGFKYRLNEKGIRIPLSNAPIPDQVPVEHPKKDQRKVPANSPFKANLGTSTREFLSGKPKKIKSSYLTAAKYDAESNTLRLAFQGQPGVWHKYGDISKEEAKSFFSSSSKGKWFHDNIKGRGSKKGEHVKPWKSGDWIKQPSKATVKILGDKEAQKKVFAILSGLVDSEPDKNVRELSSEIASMVGAPDDAEVHVRMAFSNDSEDDAEDTVIEVHVHHADYDAQREIYRDNQDRLKISNQQFFIRPSAQGKNVGTKVLAKQVFNAKKQGVDYITTFAGGIGSAHGPQHATNGYYTWPRLGYDTPISLIGTGSSNEMKELGIKVRRKIKYKWPKAKTLQDVIRTKEGREWWKENGVGSPMQFFLTGEKAPRNMKILNAYLHHLQLKGKL